MTLAGIRPRSLISIPCSMAQARTWALSRRLAGERPAPARGLRLILRARARRGAMWARNRSAFAALRSISYPAAPSPKRRVSSAEPPSRSSSSVTPVFAAIPPLPVETELHALYPPAPQPLARIPHRRPPSKPERVLARLLGEVTGTGVGLSGADRLRATL